jgi:hypothetical protein
LFMTFQRTVTGAVAGAVGLIAGLAIGVWWARRSRQAAR